MLNFDVLKTSCKKQNNFVANIYIYVCVCVVVQNDFILL